jgi:hypothetical protein
MRKYRKFTEGGATDPLEEYNKGENLDTTPGPKARRDSEEVVDEMGTASKFRRNTETGDLYSEEPITRPSAPKAKPKTIFPSGTPGGAYRGQRAEGASEKKAEAPKSAASQGSRAVIPGGGQETEVEKPTPSSRVREGMSDTVKKALAASGALGVGTLGLGIGYKAYKASDTAKRAQIAKAIREGAESAPVTGGSAAARTTSETGRKFGPKAEMEAAESTMRGAVGRKDIQAKRAATAKGRAETMESKKPVMQATPKKPSPRARTRDEDTDYELLARGGRVGYASGGSVKGSGCEQRGLRRCKVV